MKALTDDNHDVIILGDLLREAVLDASDEIILELIKAAYELDRSGQ